MKALIVIPARFASTRFPGKPLAPIAGKSLIQRVVERAGASRLAAAIYVATDDERIFDHVQRLGANVVMTSSLAATGTDRIAAALNAIEEIERSHFDQIVNVQGDEPLIDISSTDDLIDTLRTGGADVATLACPLATDEEFRSRDVVKVVTAPDGTALYFSRAPIPWGTHERARRHVGLYAFRREVLLQFPFLEQTPLEKAESLEQLRLLENGFKIAVRDTSSAHLGVDRPEDIALVESELLRRGER